jgi:hypothetical protein
MIREGAVVLLLATAGMASTSLAKISGNPVRAYQPAGEEGYLSRLSCADGSRLGFRRTGSIGAGPYGTILDDDVKCGATHYRIVMDMYHPGCLEDRAVPGFSSMPLRKM